MASGRRYSYLDKVSPRDSLTDEVNLRLLAYERPDKHGYLPSFKVNVLSVNRSCFNRY